MPANEKLKGDGTLLAAAAAGDAAAFAELVERYYSMVHTIAYGRTRHRETAEDLAQEVFLRTYLALDRITIPSQFAGWLVRVTHNMATDWNRRGIQRSKLVQMVPIEESHMEIADKEGKDARAMMHSGDSERAMQEAIFSLPETQRDIVLLHYTEGLSKKEIAERLGVHPSSVGRQLQQAIAVLRDRVDGVLRETGPSMRPTRTATARAVAMIGAASVLGVEGKAAIVTAAGGAYLGSISSASTAAVTSTSLLANRLLPILKSGWRVIMSAKGLTALVVVSGFVGTSMLQHQFSVQAAGPQQPTQTAAVAVRPAAATPAPAAAPRQTTQIAQVASRELHFPTDRSLGWLKTEDDQPFHDRDGFYYWTDGYGYDSWEHFADARGTVVIPPGKRVHLTIGPEGIRDLSPLKDLPAGSIYQLSFVYEQSGGVESKTIATDDAMRNVAQLQGLRYLDLTYGKVSANGLAQIRNMQSLERLAMPARVNRDTLSVACSMPWLKSLYLGFLSDLSDPDFQLLAGLPALEELALMGNGKFTDGALAVVPQLKQLRYIIMKDQIPVLGTGMAYLAQAPSLRTVNLGPTPITDAGLADLSRSRTIRNLSLCKNPKITDAGMGHLRQLPTLQKLDISHTQIGDEGLASLAAMKQLESLSFGPEVTDRGLSYVAQLPNLKVLRIAGVSYVSLADARKMYTPDGVRALLALASLEELSLGNNLIDDSAMETIGQMTNLKRLTLFGCPITTAGFARLGGLRNLECLDVGLPTGTRGGPHSPNNVGLGSLAVLNNMPELRTVAIDVVSQDGGTLNLSGLGHLQCLRMSLANGHQWRDEDLASLSALTELKTVCLLPKEGVTDKGVQHIAGLANLETLTVGGTEVTDAGLKNLSGMRRLITVFLKGNFTDQGLAAFDGANSLERLTMESMTPLSERALQGLKTRLPNLVTLQAGVSQPAPVGAMTAGRK